MANPSSEDETDTLPTRIQPYQFEPVRLDFERVPEHRVSFEANPMQNSMGFAKSHSLKCSHVTDGEPETVVSAILQKIKSIKNEMIFFFSSFFFPPLNLKLVTHLSII